MTHQVSEGWTPQASPEGVEAKCISTAGLNLILPCALAAKDIESWGFKPHARVRAGLWWNVEDVPKILNELQVRIGSVKVRMFP